MTAASFSLALAIALVAAREASAKPSSRKTSAGPTIFGRVFEANRASLVRVQGRPSTDAWSTGFIIGAEGEVVFGAHTAPDAKIRVRTEDGVEHDGELLGFDLALSLAIGRIAGEASGAGARSALRGSARELDQAAGGGAPQVRRASFAPLRVSVQPGLAERSWVVIMKHDAKGRAEPFAGVVDADPRFDIAVKSPIQVLVSPVLVPGSAGSPVLSAEGELIGVALDEGARRTRVAAIESIVPFLKAVVLGKRTEQR